MKYLIQLIQAFNRQISQLFSNDIFSFSFATLFVTGLLLVLPRTYGIDDDVVILFNAEQGFLSEFVSFFYLKLLHFLYQFNVPWYGLTLYVVHILSLFVLVSSLARIKSFDMVLIPFLIVYLYFYSFFVIQVSYTSTSIMVGANSLFAFLVYLSSRKINNFYVLGLGILFSLSFLIRMYGAYAVLVYGFPIIGLFLIYQYQKTKYLVIFFIPFLLLVIGDHLARIYLTSSEYQQYREFNILRGKLHGFPTIEANRHNDKILAKNNWTKNDYARFADWVLFFDERKYNTNTLSNVFKYSVLETEKKIPKYLSLYVQKLSKFINHPENKWHLYFLLLIYVLIIFKFYWFLILITLGYLFYAISFSIYLDIFHRFPARIAHPILLMSASFVILLIFQWSAKFPTQNTHHSFLATIFVVGIFWFLFNISMHHRLSTNTAFNLSLNRLQSSYQGKVFLVQPMFGLNWKNMDPLKKYHLSFAIIPNDTGTFSPRFYNSLGKLGMKKGYEIIQVLMNNPNAYIIAESKDGYFITLLLDYIMENYHIKCRVVVIEQLANGRVILKLKPLGSKALVLDGV